MDHFVILCIRESHILCRIILSGSMLRFEFPELG
jgi:hypothetical protein